jgi:DNA-directed RNA polymerase specialized sigma24 family protein
MSAAVQFPLVWTPEQPLALCGEAQRLIRLLTFPEETPEDALEAGEEAQASLEFYRRHTEALLHRYLYASMQVGRAPSALSDPVARGWVSSRPVKSFEDALIFVLDVERCLEKLNSFDRQMIERVVLQEYTQAEAAVLLGMSARSLGNKYPLALDRLTEKLLAAGLLLQEE